MSSSAAVEIASLVKHYGRTTAVDGISLTVRTGTITSVLGPNGAGKTTTIECCEGFRTPDSGTVRVLGLDPRRDGAQLRPRIGVMLQEGAGLYPGARAPELLTHLARLHAHPLAVAPLIERLELGESGRTPVRRLSGGQRQRVALAAALVGRPEVVFLDEPTAGVDPRMRRSVWDLLTQLRDDGVTVVLTTHLIDEAERLSDHVIIIDDGGLVTEGSPQELTRDADSSIRFTGPPRLDLSGLVDALPEGAAADEAAPGRYVIRATVNPQLLATVTSWCATHDIMPEGLQVGRKTLEDVVLERTGRKLTP
ncbi:ATP-binding cassette domain-containing protein [Phytoactinopolyspora mesophila]|uniref:ATP-binding cassette domain-containing protein n=1 Tax=Phytoactinopolyspora mesophila TaxID=2650750 RepID=A0A7K3LX30_9ACTN|nr:ATP-binding cassette domain-containing protein [Phytoactinopolyspora mesophila]